MRVNEEEIPWQFQREEERELLRDLRRLASSARDEEVGRIARGLLRTAEARHQSPPVELKDVNAEILKRFVKQARNERSIDRDALEFVCQIIEDLYVGRSFDSICPLPDNRDPLEFVRQILGDAAVGPPFDRICPLPSRDKRGKREKQQDRNRAIIKGVEDEMRARNITKIEAIKTVGPRWGIEDPKRIQKMFEERSKKERNVNPQIPESGE